MNVNIDLLALRQIKNTVLGLMLKPSKINGLSLLILLALINSACTSTTGPVVVRDVSSVPDSRHVDKGGKENQAVNNTTSAKVDPVFQAKQSTVIPLVEKLVVRSGKALNQNENDQAISLAEQGLRINRKEPRLYLVLSKAYKNMKNIKQSIFFAKQGMQYAQKSTAVFTELYQLAN